MAPLQTSEFSARLSRSSSLCTNFAGGRWSCLVKMGHSARAGTQVMVGGRSATDGHAVATERLASTRTSTLGDLVEKLRAAEIEFVTHDGG